MTLDHDPRLTCLIAFMLVVPAATTNARGQSRASLVESRAAVEAFLSTASVVGNAGLPPNAATAWRVTLADGTRTHDAGVETADGSDPTRRNYKFNVAAYELSKLLGLNLVVPSIERVMSGRPASVTWWMDDFAMNELERRRKKIEPPDPERWHRQVQMVRAFDELIANTYRDPAPALYLNTVWDNLLITKDWSVWITDHTGAFRTRGSLQDPESLVRCERLLLGRLRALDAATLQRTLGTYLSPQQLDALNVRRGLLAKHFDEQIARHGDAAVLYDLPPGP
jgi:hypothetical protein